MTKEQIDKDIKLFWETLEETRRFIKELSSKQPTKLYGTETKLCIIDESTVLDIDNRLKRRKDADLLPTIRHAPAILESEEV